MSLSLLDWRRQVAALYVEVRQASDTAAAHGRWRKGRNQLLAHHPDSPVPAASRTAFEGVPVAPYDPRWRFEVEIEVDVAPLRIEVVTGTDGVVPFDRLGVVDLEGVGTLDVWWLASYGGGIFVPIKDALAGTGTYGGGRYVIDTAKGADLGGVAPRMVIDLNFSYNPSCAYDPRWACPLAPPGNVVAVPVPVGELLG